MSDIFTVDTAKMKVRFALYFILKELTKTATEHGLYIPKGQSVMTIVHEDLRVCPNRAIRKIYKKLIEGSSYMKEHNQMATAIDFLSFGLWISYHDTAWRPFMFWFIDEMLNDPELKEDIKPFVKKPSDWYCPVWHDTKENTKELREKGELTKFHISPDEMIFVPENTEIMKKELLKMQGEMQKQLRLRDRDSL